MRIDRNIIKLTAIVMVIGFVFAAASWADIPMKINYQGMLTDVDAGNHFPGLSP